MAAQINIFVKPFTILFPVAGLQPGALFNSARLRHRFGVTALLSLCQAKAGGEGGIRTPVGLSPKAVFKTAAIDHSATSPLVWQGVKDLNLQPTVLETATLPIELTPYTKFFGPQLD